MLPNEQRYWAEGPLFSYSPNHDHHLHCSYLCRSLCHPPLHGLHFRPGVRGLNTDRALLNACAGGGSHTALLWRKKGAAQAKKDLYSCRGSFGEPHLS